MQLTNRYQTEDLWRNGWQNV